jgi:uncharacterized membrane protein YhiD involved in acid resistance
MTFTTRLICATSLVVLAAVPAAVGRAQEPAFPVGSAAAPGALARDQAQGTGTTPTAGQSDQSASNGNIAKTSDLSEEQLAKSAWDVQIESLWHALFRLPTAALLSAVLAFRPRRRGTPKRQVPVIQTQIILAIVGSMVMLVVGASLARAFGIVGAAGLIRYRAKVDDPKDAGVMLSTLAIGLASGVGLYVFAAFGAVFVLGVLWILESLEPEPYVVFDLTIATEDSASLKDAFEGVFRRRKIPFELRSTSDAEICYQLKMPLDIHTDSVSDALSSLSAERSISVKWEQMKDRK